MPDWGRRRAPGLRRSDLAARAGVSVECTAHTRSAPPRRDVRPSVLRTLGLLEPGIAVVTNRLGDVLARTTGFEAVTRGSGLLDADMPNLTRYVFTDPRARAFFADWDEVADERAFELWHGPSGASFEWFTAELAPAAGPDFTRRLNRHVVPRRGPLRLHHPSGCALELVREPLELPEDAQQLVVFLPADEATARAVDGLAGRSAGRLRAV
ncbi:transcriptional regulator [Streptomyces cyaneofuscatus]|uniref:MmyB family transcriptional regulator n=1 Tax=Streptomyces cyaneofuscatus TaxID=66883 RepID=UPI00381AE2E7